MDIKQAIHSALLSELLKLDDEGKWTNLIPLIHNANLTVKPNVNLKNEKGCIDVIVSYPRGIYSTGESRILVTKEDRIKYIALELVTDVKLYSDGVGKVLEQVDKYKREYEDTRVIIPIEYKEQYHKLFFTKGVAVHTWKGTRSWKCKKCNKITLDDHSSMKPYSCSNSSCNYRELFFIGLKNVEFK